MANTLDRKIILDGPRNAIVKLTGFIDTSDANVVPAVSLDDFTSNEQNANLVGFRVNEIEYSISDPLIISLEWAGTVPQQIAPIAGRGELCAHEVGGYLPDTTRAGYDGTINMRTLNHQAGKIEGFTVQLELIKLYN